MTIQNLATRQRMAKCFKEAVQHLWSGNGAYVDMPGCRYICITFGYTSASAATRRACESLITKRLGNYASVEEWLANMCLQLFHRLADSRLRDVQLLRGALDTLAALHRLEDGQQAKRGQATGLFHKLRL